MLKNLKQSITRLWRRVTGTSRPTFDQDKRYFVMLHITDGPSNDDICDDLVERLGGRVVVNESFTTAEMLYTTCVRSERDRRVRPEDAILTRDGLPCSSLLKRPVSADNLSSQLWHFAGSAWFIDREICFCEYDASKRCGGIIIAFDGILIPQLVAQFPQLEQSIKPFQPEQYEWLLRNW